MSRYNTDVYYRIMISDGDLIVVCLQSFDENDYNAAKWFSEDTYATKEEAQKVVDRIDLYVARNVLNRGR
jgi:hypothetical protein